MIVDNGSADCNQGVSHEYSVITFKPIEQLSCTGIYSHRFDSDGFLAMRRSFILQVHV